MSQAFLLNHLKPYPDETLVSWLWRLAKANYLDAPLLFIRHIRARVPAAKHLMLSSVNSIRDVQILQEVANLGMISVEDVYDRTIHRFVSIFTPAELEMETVQLPSGAKLRFLPKRPTNDFYAHYLTYCPCCLNEASYVRWHWQMPMVVLCLKHRCYLIDACPQCHTYLSEVDLIYGQCKDCGFQLCSAEALATPDDVVLLQWQTTLMNWLHKHSVPDDPGLPKAPVNTLLMVIQGLRYAAQRAGNDWHFHHIPDGLPVPNLDIVKRRHLTLAERSSLYCTAFRGLLDWPHGFYAFLDAYRARSHDMDDKGLRREFGSLYMSWFMRYWRQPAFDFVNQCFNTYIVDHIPAAQVVNSKWVTYYPDILERFDYCNAPYAAQQLGLPVPRIHRIAQDGALTTHCFGKYQKTTLYSRSEVERLKQRWQQHLTRKEAGEQLGVSLEIIQQLLQANLLQAVLPREGIERYITYISQDSIEALLHQLKQHIQVQSQIPSDHVYIAESSILCSCSVKQNYAQLLQRIIQGKLVAYHVDPTILPLGKIWFLQEDVIALPQVLKEERRWLSLTETLQHMDVKRSTLQHFFDSELLTPIAGSGQKRFFSRDQVFELKAGMVSSREAADLLKIPLSTVSQLARCRSLIPISGPGVNRHSHYIFVRGDLLKWREKHLLYSEVKAFAADHPNALALVKQSLKPVSTNPKIYLRKEVMAVLDGYP